MMTTTPPPTTPPLPTCVTGSGPWSSGFGACDTYVQGHSQGNYGYCDQDTGSQEFATVKAEDACPECGKCTVDPSVTTPPTTVPPTPSATGSTCPAIASTWKSNYGNCATYVPGAPNHPYCAMDTTKAGLGLPQMIAQDVCAGCGQCTAAQTSAPSNTGTGKPACHASASQWASGYGACETYAPGHQKNNYPYCTGDSGTGSLAGVKAKDACAECGVCEAATPVTGCYIEAAGGSHEDMCLSMSQGDSGAHCVFNDHCICSAGFTCSDGSDGTTGCTSWSAGTAVFCVPEAAQPSCPAGPWSSNYGQCSSYAIGTVNHGYCSSDTGTNGLKAIEACAECGQCA